MELVAYREDRSARYYVLRTGASRDGPLGQTPLAVILTEHEGQEPQLGPVVAEQSIYAQCPYFTRWAGSDSERARVEGVAALVPQ